MGIISGVIGFFLVYESYFADPTNYVIHMDLVILLDVVCGIATFLLYPLRHRYPVPVVAAIVVLSTFSVLSAVLSAMAVISLATRRKPYEITGIAFLFAVCSIAGDKFLPSPEPVAWWEALLYNVLFIGVIVLTGLYIGGRRQLLQSLRNQARSAERENQAHIHTARADERTRIAREMHDVLAHRLSLVALHAGALEYRTDLSAETTRETATVIRDNAHKALGELREVLGMLRDPNTLFVDENARPQPTLGQLRELLAQSRAVGTEVLLTMSPGFEERLALLPESTSRHLYRVIQEALTNALRHAPGAEVELCLAGKPGRKVHVQLSNRVPLPADPGAFPANGEPRASMPCSGLGLTGLQERVRLAGGELTVEQKDNGKFVLKAWLPWQK